ncbi:hypothetical protein FM107_17025 [Sphingobacterium sp. JB170]|nr:hypothetical protein FM107_17025 [Sphingobacterium sp. JB170]
MKILKYILFVILGSIALVLIVAFFLPKKFHAENKITINRPNTDNRYIRICILS